MHIKMNFSELQQASNQLKRQEEAFAQSISSMEGTIGSLASAWEGMAAKAFIEQFEALKPSFDKTRELIGIISLEVEDAMATMQEVDEDVASRLEF